MPIIENGNAFSREIFSTEDMNNPGEIKLSKNNSVENSSAHMAALITLAFKKVAGIEENKTGGPSLRPPVGNIDDAQWAAFASVLHGICADPELENNVEKIQASPALVKKEEALRTQATALSGDVPRSDAAGFNIMNISSQPTDLLIAFLLLMLQSRITEAYFNSTMTIHNAAAVAKSADSIRSEGVTQTATGVVSGVLGMGLGIGGAVVKMGAKIKERQNQQNVLTPMKDRQLESKTVNDALTGAKGNVKSGDELNSVKVKGADGSEKTIPLAPSGKELSPENEAKISKTINDNDSILNRGDALANEANQKTIDNWNTTGDLLIASGAIGGVISAGAHVATAADRAQQKTSDLDSRVADLGGNDARDKAKALIALINEMLQSMVAFNQSRNATFAAVAGNLRG
jgi:invasin C